MHARVWTISMLMLVAGLLGGWAQPGGEATPPSDQPEPAEASPLRDRLERARASLEGAIARLDAGEPPREVARDVWWAAREDAGPRGEGRDRIAERRRPDREERPEVRLTQEEFRTLILRRLPGLSPRIEELDRTAPDQAGALVERLGRRVHEVEAQTEDDPELRALRLRELEAGLEVFEAMRSLRASFDRGETTREEVVEALAVKLGAHFDARLAVTRHEVERLRERLARMEGELEAMGDRRASEVDKMTERMLSTRGRDGIEGPSRRGPTLKPDRP